jgi:hypothetical protein
VLASATGGRQFPHTGLADGDEVDLGGLRLQAIATPGHIPEHVAFVPGSVSYRHCWTSSLATVAPTDGFPGLLLPGFQEISGVEDGIHTRGT